MQPPASDRPACTRPLAQAATEQDTRSSGVIRGYQESSGVITRPLAQTATSRTYGQDSSGSASMGSSGVIMGHHPFAHSEAKAVAITPCRKSLQQSA